MSAPLLIKTHAEAQRRRETISKLSLSASLRLCVKILALILRLSPRLVVPDTIAPIHIECHPWSFEMPRIIRGGLIQATLCEPATSPVATIKAAMIEKHDGLIAQAASRGV